VKIAIVSERARGRGASEASWNLATELENEGHDIGYFFAEKSELADSHFRLARQFGSWEETNFDIKEIRKCKYGSDKWLEALVARRNNLANIKSSLMAYLSQFAPDIVHVHNVGAIGGHNLVASLGRSYPVIWTAHDRYPFELFHNKWIIREREFTTWEYSPNKEPTMIGFEMFKSLPFKIQFLTPSNWLTEIGKTKLTSSVHPVTTVPNLIPEMGKVSAKRLAQSLGVDLVGLSVITDTKYELKGFETIKKAMKEFQVNNPDKKVAIVVTTTNHLGLSDRNIYSLFDLFYLGIVTDNGYLSKADMSKLYAGSDVLIVASLAENMPNVIIEASSMSIPTIGTDVGGIPEVVQDGKTGWVIPTENAESLNIALTEATSNPDMRIKMGENAKESYESSFSPTVVLKQHEAIYQKCVSEYGENPLFKFPHSEMELGETKYPPQDLSQRYENMNRLGLRSKLAVRISKLPFVGKS
tara:strand:- start:3493 stop:4905 length:1413 start_codon:yes stop_codon:yes gene_type:complete